jgi:transposase
MSPREERGLVIAALCKLSKTEGDWLVPSQSGGERIYRVNVEAQTCTCPDHQEAGQKCKHLYAVEFTIKREVHADGAVTETRSVTFTEKKVYRQVWPSYNAAQQTEKRRLQVLLADLCRHLPEPERGSKPGPKPHLVKDAVFAMAFKVYCGFSGRRFSCDLADAHKAGHTFKLIPGAKVSSFFENATYTPILTQLVQHSAAPLAVVDTEFATDSTGFSTSRFETWFDHKYGITRRRALWIKAHCAVGVKTNVVTAVRILEKDTADSPQLPDLVQTTRESFTVKEVSADAAYASLDNFDAVAHAGGTLFAAFKSSTTGAIGGLFEKMFRYFQYQQEEYMAHYHKRSNAESTFSAVKRKFGDAVMSKTDTAMKNEVLCKLLCHNLTCLIQEQETLGIVPLFWKNELADPAPAVAATCNAIAGPETQSAGLQRI